MEKKNVSPSFAIFGNIIEVCKICTLQRNLFTIFLKVLNIYFPYEKKVLVSIGSSTFFANFQYFRAKKVLGPILTNTFFFIRVVFKNIGES